MISEQEINPVVGILVGKTILEEAMKSLCGKRKEDPKPVHDLHFGSFLEVECFIHLSSNLSRTQSA